MNSMRTMLIIYLCFVPSLLFGEDTGVVTDYTQSYVLLIKGTPAGSETVVETIRADGDIVSTSEHEIFLTDGIETNMTAFSTKMVFRNAEQFPISYSYKQKTGDFYEVAVEGKQITRTLNRGGNISVATAQVTPDLVLLDFNVYHQYDYLVKRYDIKKGGRQIFADFIPLIANDIPIALTYLGSSDMKFKKFNLKARNFQVEFLDIWTGTLSVDENNRLVRLNMPAQDLEVIRKDLVP